MDFELKSDFKPTGDQPGAIESLTKGVFAGEKNQVLLGVTGSGKTFIVANVIQNIQKPTLVISHNKTLAAQLYQEFRDFFPNNAVSYFVSYYDYYQPEAYIPQTDTYIEKETEINEQIDKLRLSATMNLLTRKDTIIVASVSCIYNLGSPIEYGKFIMELATGIKTDRTSLIHRLVDLQYERSEYQFKRSTFRVRGEYIEVYLGYEDYALRIEIPGSHITRLSKIDTLTGNVIEELKSFVVYPAKHYLTDPKTYDQVFPKIREDLDKRIKELEKLNKNLEAQRLKQRVNYDLEMIKEIGYVNGIENYSRYFDGRNPGDPPYSLLEYFPKDYLLVIDESHMTLPQIRGMYNGDRSRKQTLIDYGFRLPAALDNRPLKFDEFMRKVNQTIYVSATPDEYEISLSKNKIVEQLIRPTGIVDPEVFVKPTKGQIEDLISEINKRVAKKERVLVTTLTKKMAEELAEYLEEQNIKVHYLHSDIQTLNRTDILDKLRNGEYDVLVGINLLREGLDLPEVTLVAILDADKEGFLRSQTSLIQVMGRAARNINSQVIMYADNITGSMKRAVAEVERRRKKQVKYNIKNNITPSTINKPIKQRLVEFEEETKSKAFTLDLVLSGKQKINPDLNIKNLNAESMTPSDKKNYYKLLNRLMHQAAAELNFEEAAVYRDLRNRVASIK